MKSILLVSDVPAWAISYFAAELVPHLPEFRWTPIFWTETSQERMAELVASHDLVLLLNADYALHFLPVFEAALHPRIVMRICSHRYPKDAEHFARSFARVVLCSNAKLAEHFARFSNARQFPEAIQPHFVPSRPVRVGFVGEVCEYKGTRLIAEACRQFGAELVIRARSDKRLPPDEMARWYEAVDCVVVASEAEGFNTIAVEAMAMNRPLLTTDTGVAAELDCLKVGRSVDGIVAGLNRLFGRRQVVARFAWDVVGAKYRELLNEVLA